MNLSEIEPESLDRDELVDSIEVLTERIEEYEERITDLEEKALRRDSPEAAALRRCLEAVSDREVGSTSKSWLIASTHAEQRMDKLSGVLKNVDGSSVGDSDSTLERYASIPEDQRKDLLGATDRRAVVIYENWDDIAERATKGWALSTRRSSVKKNAPSKIRTELNKILDDELAWAQIYRAMKAVAELSGSEQSIDEGNRIHLTGGDFEYHERVTPDNEETYKVLVEVNR
ncbi:hypothetical protein [Halorhabdus sp. CBA1104]|uniref:hypothetical protein n=1 Tax=Halorhabdus sp. CBA1104 TaxID=1380432 RepID=UPI0012B1DB5C|nr:hypothetical protein [Halorhabdus sp. CBA1104]